MIKINVDQFAILSDSFQEQGLSYTVELGFKAATDAKRLACGFVVEFAQEHTPIIKLGVTCEFELNPEDWTKRVKNGLLTITKEELGFFANQTVGVSRGIMYCKTEGTPFVQFIVPPVNLAQLIKEDFNIKID